ncbi:glycosyltransferase family 2 protein [Paenibacillus roseipurpureus]|uniref:Glycosyltransferase family 2 protein n=1 Tax=Paenibacillus roseopurpureus TaxID=2918901 RepID=A0AA96LSF2_9BACL|nr:glycosyltransferase family 2 protein [Paenibacillus sp. MBLB1832]WNR43885.1 glycosyltransferase family 2 protein [Paenibacillus sp. MBLB1832]
MMVSVIMCVFNTNESVLKRSIQSILLQTFSDFELIICDDGSTDNTYEILLNISNSDTRIKLIKNDINMKAAAARNRCISLCQGKYIAVMDADDFSDLNRLKIQTNFLESNNKFDFVGSSAYLYNEKGIWGRRKYAKFPTNKDFLFVLPFIHASVMFRKKALMEVGGYRIAKETIRTEDYDLFMRLYASGCKGANIEESLYYIQEDQSLYKRRKYYHKFNEAIVRCKGFRALGLLPGGFFYVIKPLIVGVIPNSLLNLLKEIFYKHKKMVDK